MSRGTFPKAYLRIDPNIDQHPDAGLLLRLLCAANRQVPRGRFKTWAHVEAALGKPTARKARDAHHIVDGEDGGWLVDGWDEWQEGDVSVGDRMRRLRARGGGSTRTANWRLRNEVYARDHYSCRYCGIADYEREWLVADHVIPLPDGPTTAENLATACRPCNKRKGARTPEQAGMPLLSAPASYAGDASQFDDVTRHQRQGDASQFDDVTRHQRNSPSEALGVRRKKRTTTTDYGLPPAVADGGGSAAAVNPPNPPTNGNGAVTDEPPPTPATPAEASALAIRRLGRKAPPSWLTPFGDAWRARWGAESEPPWGEMAQQLARPAKELLRDDLLARWTRWLDATERAEWARPARFVQGLGQWAESTALSVRGVGSARSGARAQQHRADADAFIRAGLKGDGTA